MIELSDATKNQFIAPWRVVPLGGIDNPLRQGEEEDFAFDVVDAKGQVVCESDDRSTANNIARLPELYDALMAATKRCCSSADDRCPKQGAMWTCCRKCTVLPWLELLQKVRNCE